MNGDRPVLSDATAPAEPRQGVIDDPAQTQNNGACQVRAFDDFDRQPINVRDHCLNLLPGIAAIGEQSGERGIRIAGSLDQTGRPVAVLNIGAKHYAFQHIAQRVRHDVPPFDLAHESLALLSLLAGVVSARPTRLGGLD